MKLIEGNKNTLVEDVEGVSQYDGMQVLKDVHSLPGHYLRTKDAFSLVKGHFDYFKVEYDDSNNPIIIQYLVGITPHLTTIGLTANTGSALAGTGFIIASSRMEKRYAIYYTVDGQGDAPNIAGVQNIEVALEDGDSANIVALASKLAIDSIGEFKTKVSNSVLEIETLKLGETYNTILLPASPFMVQNTEGGFEQIEQINIAYSESGNPIWQGQELKGHKYNIYTAKFETYTGSEFSYENVNGKQALNVINVDEVVWNEIVTSFPDTVTDLFTYSYEGSPVQTVRVVYQDTSKSKILSVTKTRL